MSRVRSKNTGPEVRVRSLAHRLGLRFRLHRSDLPGKPDLIFPRLNLALFVHGCYWHRHPGCSKASAPSSHFWAAKFRSNVARDKRVQAELRSLGWKVFTIWECETKQPLKLEKLIRQHILRRKIARDSKQRIDHQRKGSSAR